MIIFVGLVVFLSILVILMEFDYRNFQKEVKRNNEESIRSMRERARLAREQKLAMEEIIEEKIRKNTGIPKEKRRYKPLKNPTIYGKTRRYYRNHK